jgi:response regulator RpfG family c-di-GMP phosphodiesterase
VIAMRERQFPDARILIVDDEPANVLLLERTLERGGYSQVVSTDDGREVAALVESFAPDLLLLDLHMPNHDGFAVLEELGPVLESGFFPVVVLTADVTREAKELALSLGALDFLTKPLDTTEVLLRIRNLLQTRALHLSERVLLEQTLEGSIEALTEILAMVNPAGFSRAARAKRLVRDLVAHLGREPAWEVEVAALLSQVGVVTLAPETVDKLYLGKSLTHSETVAAARLPEIAAGLVSRIPRLDGVAEILAHQNLRYDGRSVTGTAPRGAAIPWGARVLRLLLDLDVLESRGIPPQAVMETIRQRTGWYDPELVAALAEMREIELKKQHVVEIELREVSSGMLLAEDVITVTGMLLVARGQQVTPRLVERLLSSAHLFTRGQRVHVILPQPRAARESAQGKADG